MQWVLLPKFWNPKEDYFPHKHLNINLKHFIFKIDHVLIFAVFAKARYFVSLVSKIGFFSTNTQSFFDIDHAVLFADFATSGHLAQDSEGRNCTPTVAFVPLIKPKRFESGYVVWTFSIYRFTLVRVHRRNYRIYTVTFHLLYPLTLLF